MTRKSIKENSIKIVWNVRTSNQSEWQNRWEVRARSCADSAICRSIGKVWRMAKEDAAAFKSITRRGARMSRWRHVTRTGARWLDSRPPPAAASKTIGLLFRPRRLVGWWGRHQSASAILDPLGHISLRFGLLWFLPNFELFRFSSNTNRWSVGFHFKSWLQLNLIQLNSTGNFNAGIQVGVSSRSQI